MANELSKEVTARLEKFISFFEDDDCNGFRKWVAELEPRSNEAVEVYGIIGACLDSHIQCYLWAMASLSIVCLLYTSPSPRDGLLSRMPSSA